MNFWLMGKPKPVPDWDFRPVSVCTKGSNKVPNSSEAMPGPVSDTLNSRMPFLIVWSKTGPLFRMSGLVGLWPWDMCSVFLDSLDRCDRALEFNPDDERIWFNRGIVLRPRAFGLLYLLERANSFKATKPRSNKRRSRLCSLSRTAIYKGSSGIKALSTRLQRIDRIELPGNDRELLNQYNPNLLLTRSGPPGY